MSPLAHDTELRQIDLLDAYRAGRDAVADGDLDSARADNAAMFPGDSEIARWFEEGASAERWLRERRDQRTKKSKGVPTAATVTAQVLSLSEWRVRLRRP